MVMVAHVYALALSETLLAPLVSAGTPTVAALYTGFGLAAFTAHTLLTKCKKS